jgi:hypothetical protein
VRRDVVDVAGLEGVGCPHLFGIDPARWREAFEVAMGRIAGRFARVEPRCRAGRLVLGLLSDLPRKNCCRGSAEASLF